MDDIYSQTSKDDNLSPKSYQTLSLSETTDYGSNHSNLDSFVSTTTSSTATHETASLLTDLVQQDTSEQGTNINIQKSVTNTATLLTFTTNLNFSTMFPSTLLYKSIQNSGKEFTEHTTSLSNFSSSAETNGPDISVESNNFDKTALAAVLGTLAVLSVFVVIVVLIVFWKRKQKMRRTMMKLRSISQQSRDSTHEDPPDICLDTTFYDILDIFSSDNDSRHKPDIIRRSLSAHEDALNFSRENIFQNLSRTSLKYHPTSNANDSSQTNFETAMRTNLEKYSHSHSVNGHLANTSSIQNFVRFTDA